MASKTEPIESFEFLNPLDGETYTLPPFDAEKFADEVGTHKEFIPEVSMTDALLADDPQTGMDLLQEPMQKLNLLMKRAIVKTLRNHLDAIDPAWLALKGLIDAYEFETLAKIFTDWRTHYGDVEVEPLGED